MLKTIETIIRTFSDAFSDLNLEGEIQIDGVGSPPAGWSSLGGGVVFKTFFEFFFLESKNKIFRLKFCFFLHQKKLAFIFNFAFLFRGRLIAMSSFQNVFVIFHFFSFFSVLWLNLNTSLKATLDGGWRHQGDRSLAEGSDKAPNSGGWLSSDDNLFESGYQTFELGKALRDDSRKFAKLLKVDADWP